MIVYKISQNETHQEGFIEKNGYIKNNGKRVEVTFKSGIVYTDKGFPAGEIIKTLKSKRFGESMALYLVDRPQVKKTWIERLKGRFGNE